MKTLLKGLAIGALALVGLAVVLAAAVVAINWKDEPLLPGAAARLKPEGVRAEAAVNGFYTAIGLGADDPLAYGRRRSEVLAARGGTPEGRAEFAALPEPKVELPKAATCQPEKEPCFQRYLATPADAAAVAAAGRGLAAQYRELREYAALAEPPPNSDLAAPLLVLTNLVHGQRVVFAEIAAAVDAGKLRLAVDELAAELALHRRFLAGSQTLVTKLVARRMLQRDLLVLAQLAEARPGAIDAAARARLEPVLAPLTDAERSIERGVWNEFRLAANTYLTLPETGRKFNAEAELLQTDAWVLQQFAYQPQATVNRDYAWREAIAAAHRAPPDRLDDALKAVDAKASHEAAQLAASLAPYNFVGNRLAAVAYSDFREYALAMVDVDGLVRLVNAALRVAPSAASPAEVPAALAAAGARAADPYTGKPLAWDAATRTLSFAPRAKRSESDRIGTVPGRWSLVVAATW